MKRVADTSVLAGAGVDFQNRSFLRLGKLQQRGFFAELIDFCCNSLHGSSGFGPVRLSEEEQ